MIQRSKSYKPNNISIHSYSTVTVNGFFFSFANTQKLLFMTMRAYF